MPNANCSLINVCIQYMLNDIKLSSLFRHTSQKLDWYEFGRITFLQIIVLV